VGDAEMGEGTADLGQLRLVDLAGVLGGEEVMPAPIGVERPEQAVPADRLGEAEQAPSRLLDASHRLAQWLVNRPKSSR
jgi:hypothetical protein